MGVSDIFGESTIHAAEHLAAIGANCPGIVYRRVAYPNGRIEYPYVSAAVRANYGLEPERIIADSSVRLDSQHPEDREEIEASLRISTNDLAPWRLDFRIIDTAGKIHWMRGNSTPHRHQQGEVVWDGLLLDISESMNAVEALKSKDRRFRALIEGSIQGVLVHRDNQVLFANEECARILGFTDLEDFPAAGSVEDHLHPDEIDRLRQYGEARVRGDPVPKTYEARALRKDGSTVWLDVRGPAAWRTISTISWPSSWAMSSCWETGSKTMRTRERTSKSLFGR